MKVIGYTAAAIVLAIALAWGMGWIFQPATVAGVENVRTQFAEGYRNYESLTATAENICSARLAVAAAATPEERSQLQVQVLAQEQNYNRISAQYNAAMSNAFAAKYVAPRDLPTRAPPLRDTLSRAGC